MAVVAIILTATLIAILFLGSRLKSRRQLWILFVLFGAGAAAVLLFVGTVVLFKYVGLM